MDWNQYLSTVLDLGEDTSWKHGPTRALLCLFVYLYGGRVGVFIIGFISRLITPCFAIFESGRRSISLEARPLLLLLLLLSVSVCAKVLWSICILLFPIWILTRSFPSAYIVIVANSAGPASMGNNGAVEPMSRTMKKITMCAIWFCTFSFVSERFEPTVVGEYIANKIRPLSA